MTITGYQAEGGIFAGTLLLDTLDVNGAQTGEYDVGETSNFTVEAMKIATKDKTGHRLENHGDLVESTIVAKPQSLKFTLGDIKKKNLAMAMFGADSVVDQAAATITDEAVTARIDKEVKLTKMKLKNGADAPAVKAETPAAWEDLQAYTLGAFVSKVAPNSHRYECTTAGTTGASEPTWPTTPGETVEDGTVTWTCRKITYVEDDDYEIDYTYGMFKALAAGDIPEAEALEITFKCNAYTGFKVAASTLTKIDCLLRLKGKNIVSGKPCMVTVYKASLKPSGSLDFITEDYSKLEFTGDIKAVDAGTWEYVGLDA